MNTGRIWLATKAVNRPAAMAATSASGSSRMRFGNTGCGDTRGGSISRKSATPEAESRSPEIDGRLATRHQVFVVLLRDLVVAVQLRGFGLDLRRRAHGGLGGRKTRRILVDTRPQRGHLHLGRGQQAVELLHGQAGAQRRAAGRGCRWPPPCAARPFPSSSALPGRGSCAGVDHVRVVLGEALQQARRGCASARPGGHRSRAS